MSYYIRVFCTAPAVPPLRDVLQWCADQGAPLQIAPEFATADLQSPDWQQVGLVYKAGKQSFLAEVNRDEGSDSDLLHEEIAEFAELVAEAEAAEPAWKDAVLQHLRATRCIVANQLPTGDFDADGFRALNVFLAYFVQHCGGMVQADGEGFYANDTLIVALP